MALIFTEPRIKDIAANLLGEPCTELNHDVRDAVGGLTNMICGDARRRLTEEGFVLEAGIPKIVGGRGHTITHIASGPCLAVPFQTSQGSFMGEVAFSKQA